jgi:hypothetical protein
MPAISGKATLTGSEVLLSDIIGAITATYVTIRCSRGRVVMGDAGSVNDANGFTLPIDPPLEIPVSTVAADVGLIGQGTVEVFALSA